MLQPELASTELTSESPGLGDSTAESLEVGVLLWSWATGTPGPPGGPGPDSDDLDYGMWVPPGPGTGVGGDYITVSS